MKSWTGAELKQQILDRRGPLELVPDGAFIGSLGNRTHLSLDVNPLLDNKVTLGMFRSKATEKPVGIYVEMSMEETESLIRHMTTLVEGKVAK